ncbi:PREDICTED: histone-lysine N-methyltransferase, H3 lysine-79 specific-like [Camelina sativa]|uniref:Histone-lysine N-methyltransferase, H3 lysine-79 specific-like n=1 Tax=Camelina sativa TaxID=90675 RepID=A0ABM0TTK7_CAMSA|nr:PREDICTED: histone-lysine N-methyltransferase, H3 lysine-79 specific-like [Camelina sativa]
MRKRHPRESRVRTEEEYRDVQGMFGECPGKDQDDRRESRRLGMVEKIVRGVEKIDREAEKSSPGNTGSLRDQEKSVRELSGEPIRSGKCREERPGETEECREMGYVEKRRPRDGRERPREFVEKDRERLSKDRSREIEREIVDATSKEDREKKEFSVEDFIDNEPVLVSKRSSRKYGDCVEEERPRGEAVVSRKKNQETRRGFDRVKPRNKVGCGTKRSKKRGAVDAKTV